MLFVWDISAEPCSVGRSGVASWLVCGLSALACWTRFGKTLVGQLQKAPLLQGAEDHADPWCIVAERGCSRLPAQPSKHVGVRGSALTSPLPDFTCGALGWALGRGAAAGLPLLPLKSITPFPLGSLGTGPSAWLVVKTHNSCIHSSLVADRRAEREPFLADFYAAWLIVSPVSAGQLGGSVMGLIAAWPSLRRAGCLITWLLGFPPRRGAHADCSRRGTGFPQQAYLWAGRKLLKKSRPAECSPPPPPRRKPAESGHWKYLGTISERETREEKHGPLPRWPAWLGLCADQGAACATGFALSSGLLRSAPTLHTARQMSERETVLQACWSSQANTCCPSARELQ